MCVCVLQDYSYWYKDFFLFPHMQTVWVALDKSTRENGWGPEPCPRLFGHPCLFSQQQVILTKVGCALFSAR